MSRPVTITALAMADLDDCCAWIARDSVDAAERFRDAALGTIERTSAFPEAGSRFETSIARLGRLWWRRVDGFPNHLVFYSIDDDAIRIVRVIRGERDLPSALGVV